MAIGARLCLCLLFAFVIMCSARNTIFLSGNEMVQLASEGRSLVMTDDYSEPSANRGHDPSRNRGGGGGRKG
ncbi:hypothetical protein SO802_017950 [Lithocarpus litseifolius]|uniref:Protein PSY3-like n=1 Tax=Lithocarpus litseifolius TaxID=425828 RepID=A0AAW2CLD2_9ROSI